MVFGDDGPAVIELLDVAFTGIDHGLHREHHACLQLEAGAGPAVMQYLRIFVEALADTVAAEFANDAVALFLGIALDGIADIAECRARLDFSYAQPHAFIGDLAQTLCLDRWFADIEHAAGVAMVAILDDRDVDIDDIAILQHLVTRNAMTDLVVDGSADGFWVGRMAGRGIIQRCRDGLLHIDHVIVAERIQLFGRDASFDVGGDEIQHLGSQPAGDAHFFDIGRVLDRDCHIA